MPELGMFVGLRVLMELEGLVGLAVFWLDEFKPELDSALLQAFSLK